MGSQRWRTGHHYRPPLGALDLVVRPAGGLDYGRLASHQVEVHLHDVTVPLASLDDIIASKEAADRPKDRHAMPVLRALRARLGDS
ncbi:MAG: hypothetical protein H0U35_11115 [Sporichthyaceae bacterium]|nr:hypothetical protein [Sporichthyaceae bacterium]